MDLGGLWRGEFNIRRASALAAYLPAGSAVWKVLNLDAAWTVQEHISALIADILQGANWQRGGGKGNQPKPLPRPAEARKQADKEKRSQAQAAAFLRKQKQRELETH